MKKIDVTKAITMLDGSPILTSEDNSSVFTIGKAIANILLASKNKKNDAFKLYALAKRFYESNSIEIDDADFGLILDLIKEDQSYGVLINGQILELLNSYR